MHPCPISEVKFKNSYGFTVMHETGQLVTCGQKSFYEPWHLYIFSVEGTQIKERRALDLLCSHNEYCLLSVGVHNREYLAVGCEFCKDIKLLDLKTQKVTKAFSCSYKVQGMCHGDRDRLYIHSKRIILELDCSDVNFVEIQKLPIEIFPCNDIVYVSSPHNLIIAIGSKVQAISKRHNKLMWMADNTIDGRLWYPYSSMFSPGDNAILVCDASTSVIVTISPTDGSYIKTIPVPFLSRTHNPCLYKDQVLGMGFDFDSGHFVFTFLPK